MDPAMLPAAVAPVGGPLHVWPADFGTRFAIMVDTEEEFDWTAPFSRQSRSVTAIGALPDAHRRFADRGVPLTYLVDHPIATTPRSIDTIGMLLGDGRSAVGTHLHPWVNPPYREVVNHSNSFAGNLATEVEAAKIADLGAAIHAAFGIRPRVFRAGRYGIGPSTLATLAALDYAIDTSMRSGFSYLAEGGPDFRRIGNHAFRAGAGGALLELPLTTMWLGALRGGGSRLYDWLGRVPKARGLASRLDLLSRVALTPEEMPVTAALRAIDRALDDGVRLLNFSFHSPTVQPGMTPYVRDQADLARFHAWWDAVLTRLEQRGVRPASEAELVAAARGDALADPPPVPLGDDSLSVGL